MAGISLHIARIFLIFFASIFSLAAVAETFAINNTNSEFRMNFGMLNGGSGEYVYDAYGVDTGIPGYKLSELNWALNSVPMIGLGVSFPVDETIKLNLDYWKNAGDGDGTLDDYDWLYIGLDWSHWSHHENTVVRDVNRLDINGEFVLSSAKEKNTISGLLGFRQDHFDWQAKGGYGIYSINAYRDSYVLFPNVPGISYKQTFSTPYIGLSIKSANHSHDMVSRLNASIRFSQWVKGEDVDIHHLRALQFEEAGSGGGWLAFDLGVDLEVDKALLFTLGFSHQEYTEIKTTTVLTDLTTGAKVFYSGDVAGLDHSSNMISVGMNYRF